MTLKNHAFWWPGLCGLPSHLTLSWIYNCFNQWAMMKVRLCQFWHQPLLDLEVSTSSLLELSLLECSFWNPISTLWGSPSTMRRDPNGKRLSPLPTALAEWQPVFQMTTTIFVGFSAKPPWSEAWALEEWHFRERGSPGFRNEVCFILYFLFLFTVEN